MQPPVVAVGVFGVGLIGKALINQINSQVLYGKPGVAGLPLQQ